VLVGLRRGFARRPPARGHSRAHANRAGRRLIVGGIDGDDGDVVVDTVVDLDLRGGLADDDRTQLTVVV
jgi:hypothetical protein